MKRFISILLLALILISTVGCASSKGEKFTDINDFIKKYKYEDLLSISENPKQFINDLVGVGSVTKDSMESWEVDPDGFDTENIKHFDNEGVLFNLPANMSTTFYNDDFYHFYISFSCDDQDDDFSVVQNFCDYMFKEYGDAQKIEIEDLVSNEHNLREIFNDEDLMTEFSCEWEIDELCDMYFSYHGNERFSFISISIFTGLPISYT